ncbi:Npt1/Npt2 family nucleotide transporter [Candidatus Sneabacter namystus]|uniref:ADP,ATP carrier protein n=1 Tax=Candidatus Sneabacter namystus TaxID=2601646 RepID=A0A5C0UI02_9RICK|nr:Npt1/Npt2 family nucleotide transporter [Candidatus Sneabacter namystus]QEK39825.1 NTP/NDP exchange transporter [Candidatus Sneabacter namystus]
MSNEIKFSGLRACFWPITAHESKKIIPLASLMFFVLFNYTILRDIKDSLILTAPGCGSESFSFLKLWGTLPFAIIIMGLYSKASLVLSRPNLFRATVIMFVTFFTVFGFVIFPNADILHASPEWITTTAHQYPNFRYVIALVGNWSYSLFFIFAELWGNIALSVLFWQFANEITKISEARRVYPLLGLIANVGGFLAGQGLVVLAKSTKHLPEADRWAYSMKWVILALVICACTVLYIHHWIVTRIMTDATLYDPDTQGAKKKKVKLSFMQGMKAVFSSQYIGFLVILPLAYGITINFVEATFKNQVKIMFKTPTDIMEFYGNYSSITSTVTAVLMIIGANLTRLFSWRFCALATPVMTLVAGSLFFAILLLQEKTSCVLSSLAISPITISVYLGVALIALSKGTKYALFDPTKEMAYIPLDDDLRTQGKAAVDGVGGRLGKSGSGIIQQTFFLVSATATQMSIAPYLAMLLVGFCLIWIISVSKLSVLFEKARAEKNM